MTNEQMDALDRKLAEELMGWTDSFHADPGYKWYGPKDPDFCNVPVTKVIMVKDFHPTRNIAQVLGDGGSGTVVGEMHRKEIWLRNLDYNPYTKKWTVCFYGASCTPLMSVKAATTPALAICLAAAKALRLNLEDS